MSDRAHAYVLSGLGLIPLHAQRGGVRGWAIIDEADFEDIAQFNWCMTSGGYAHRVPPSGTAEYLHRRLLGLSPGDGLEVDHVDRNRLNNRRDNLRVLPARTANRQNMAANRGGTSLHRGVSWDKRERKWAANSFKDGRKVHLGMYAHESEAAAVASNWRRENMPYAVEEPS